MRNYATLFDMNYWPKWYVMYRSWLQWSTPGDVLWVLPMDHETFEFMSKRGPWRRVELLDPRVVIGDAKEPAGKPIVMKNRRSHAEFCWMMAPWLCHHVIFDLHKKDVTYLDADLWFTSPLKKVWDEIQDASSDVVAAVTPHRFHPDDVARLLPNGVYNVSWVSFLNDPAAKAVLRRWANQVMDRCDASTCGDQKYLDEWPRILGPQLHEFKNHGIGVAPWNARCYEFSKGPSFRKAGAEPEKLPDPVVFYHFHELRRRGPGDYHLTGYQLPTSCIEHVYSPYLRELESAYDLLAELKRNQ